jgi:hypothetical protein
MTAPIEETARFPRNWLAYNVPLRADFIAQLILPYDLSEAESKKLAAMLATLPMPASHPTETPAVEPGGSIEGSGK